MSKLLTNPDGKFVDLPDTTWDEIDYLCYENPDHNITGTTKRLYCAECGVWWWRKWEYEG